MFLSDIKPFNLLKDINISDNETIRQTATSAYGLFFVIGLLGLITTTMITGIKFAMYKNANKKSEIKSSIGFKTWLALGFFSFLFIIGTIYKIVNSFT